MKLRYRTYSFAYLLMAAHKARGRIERAKHHPFVDCLAMLTFSALAFEAFVNHLGPAVFRNWQPLKKKLSPSEKLQLIADARGVEIDWGRRPYQSVTALMKFRNMIAHAESSEYPVEVVSGKLVAPPDYWQAYCERDVAERLSDDVECIVKELPHSLGIEVPPAFLLAEAVGPPS